MADRQLIVVVEGTASMAPFWNSIVSDYLEKIIRSFCGSETTTQKPSVTSNSSSTFELALVMFNTHGPYSASLVQRSGWIKDPNNFISWLHSVTFSGGDLNDVATAEGLAEALMMFAIRQNGYQMQQNMEGKRHCILVSSSNPYPLPTPVYRPVIANLEQGENGDTHNDNHLFDAEAVAKWFGQCSVSLSVICPKPLPKLKTLYHVGKRNQRAADPIVDVKQPHFLVLISDSFIEACAVVSRAGLSLGQNSVTAVPSGGGPSLPAVNGPVVVRPPISTGNAVHATVKIEPITVTSMTSAPTLPHMPSIPRATAQTVPTLQTSSPPSVSQELSTKNENITDMKPVITMPQTVRPIGAILNNISQARVMSSAALTVGTSLALPSMGGNPTGMHMSNMISSGMSSTSSTVPPSQTVLVAGQSGITTVAGHGNIPGSLQPMKYVKAWEGNLCGQRQGEPVFITRLEGYRSPSALETLAADWPATMQIVRLISQDHMHNKQYVGKADFLIFRAMTPHGFLSQLQEKRLCVVIHLPAQTLLLSASDKVCRLIGMLFPGEMVVFKPLISTQQQQQQQPHSQPQQLPMNLQQLQQQQSMQQLQQQQSGMQKQLQHLPQQQQYMNQLQQQPQMQQQLQHLPQQHQQEAMQQLHQQQIPQLQQQQQQIPQLQQQQIQLQQQLQQLSQPLQMVGGGIGQGYMQGPGQPQLVPQGQVPSQGTPPNMPSGGFMG